MADTPSSGEPNIIVKHRIRTAWRLTRDLLRASPIKPDLMPEYVALQMWPFVVPLYHGIEQALKCLVLLQTPTANPRHYGHDLKGTFDALHDDDRQHIELHFSQHQSLHTDYNPEETGITSAATFIDHINSSGTNRREGALTWRYLLLDGGQNIPPLHLWGMVEIWDAACCRMMHLGEDGGSANESCSCLGMRLDDLVMQQHTGRGSPYEGFVDDANEWYRRFANVPLAAWVDLLCKVYRKAIYEVDAPAQLLPYLAKDATKLLQDLKSEPAGSDEWRLWAQIEETGGHFAWDYTLGIFQQLPTRPPMIPDLQQSEAGPRLMVSDLLLGDSIRVPALASLRWTERSQDPSTGVDPLAFSGPAMFWPDDAGEISAHGDEIPIPQRVLANPSLLGDLLWEVTRVERIEMPASPVQERWITAKGKRAGILRVRLRDDQQVLDRDFHASTYVPNSMDHETGQLYYFEPEDSVRPAALDKLRNEGHRYKVRSTVWSGHGDSIDPSNPALTHYSISVLLSDCRVPDEIGASLMQVLELLGTPNHHLSLVNDVGVDWKVMTATVDSPRFPLHKVGVVHRDRMHYPRSHLVESDLPTGPPALHVIQGNWIEQEQIC